MFKAVPQLQGFTQNAWDKFKAVALQSPIAVANQQFQERVAQPVVKAVSKALIYDPETQKWIPNSGIAQMSEMADIGHKYRTGEIPREQFINEMSYKAIPLVANVSTGIKAVPQLKPKVVPKLPSTGGEIGGKPLYRGGKVDLTKGSNQGISFTTNPDIARKFPINQTPIGELSTSEAKKILSQPRPIFEYTLKPNAKILTYDQIPASYKYYDKLNDAFYPKRIPGKEEYQAIVDFARKRGFDAVDLSGFAQNRESELRVINSKAISEGLSQPLVENTSGKYQRLNASGYDITSNYTTKGQVSGGEIGKEVKK